MVVLAGVQTLSAQQRDTIIIRDTIYLDKAELERKKDKDIVENTNLVRIKPIGRFDRGIVSYRFIPKKKNGSVV